MIYTADFETTTDVNDCRVWAWALCDINNVSNIEVGNSIDSFMKRLYKSKGDKVYFHNLKFDGDFILNWLFRNGFTHVKNRKEREAYTFSTLISDMDQFYSIEVYFSGKGKNERKVKFLDSFKLISSKVEKIPKGFGLEDKKLEIDYKKFREKGHKLTLEEIEYIKSDVVIVAKALKIMFNKGLNKITAGACALDYYKKHIGKHFDDWFPNLGIEIDGFIRRSYKGGFTYLNPRFKEKDIGKGIVLDVNSLYPSVMYNTSLPYGIPIYYKGFYERDKLYNKYVQRFRCQFELKDNMLPTLQIKNNLSMFVPTEYLKSSDGLDVVLTMTDVDLDLFLEHYDVYDLEFLDGFKFKSSEILFNDYIDYWYDVKQNASKEGNEVMRTLSKLFLNSLYGKFSTNPVGQSKYPYLDNDGVVKYELSEKEDRKYLYIPIGSYITSYARNKTIRSAQQVYDRFIYADTDSLHLVGIDNPISLEIDSFKLGAWKKESVFTRARFLRQKSYIEEIDGKLKITCAGMPESCYPYVNFDNFHIGSNIEGKLKAKHVSGGTVLLNSPHKLRG